jgi:peptidoglycan/LPS O-acetylase OafA/YrhL
MQLFKPKFQRRSRVFQAKLSSKIFQPQINVLELLDFCKGFAIVLVVLAHFKGGWFGWQGVHIFIVLSGFGLTYASLRRDNRIVWSEWYLKRLKKILPSYWLICFMGYLVMVGIYLFDGYSLLGAISSAKRLLFLELTLLKNFYYQTVVTPPNVSLWFVPFIVSFYLVFPWLYRLITQQKTVGKFLLVSLCIIASEFIYRACAICWLDGSPIGYRSFENLFPVLGVPFDKLSDNAFFQLEAVFSFFPARIGEFALGMVSAIALTHNNRAFHKILFNIRSGTLGFLIWLIGNALLYLGFWGWVFADFAIALGLTLWFVNLASFCQKKLPLVFHKFTQLGVWSYYIFLAHFPFVYLFILYLPDKASNVLNLFSTNWWMALGLNACLVGITLLGTWITCQMLQRFDRSKFSNLLIQQTFARFIRS